MFDDKRKGGVGSIPINGLSNQIHFKCLILFFSSFVLYHRKVFVKALESVGAIFGDFIFPLVLVDPMQCILHILYFTFVNEILIFFIIILISDKEQYDCGWY